MFTVKLMKGENNSVIKIIEAREVEVRLSVRGDTSYGNQHGIIVTPPTGEPFWHYVGQPDWEMVVVENATGRTTEVIRAENPTEYAATPRKVA